MKYIVTGGRGFIGANVVKRLHEQKHNVVVVDNKIGGKGVIHSGVRYYDHDIADYERMQRLIGSGDILIHLAAIPEVQRSIEQPISTHTNNVTGMLLLLEAARKKNVERIVFASSCAVYGSTNKVPTLETHPLAPESPYAYHKATGEMMLRVWAKQYGIPSVALRFYNVYGKYFKPDGPYAGVVGKFITERRNDRPLPVCGTGTHTRDYVNVRDVVDATMKASKLTLRRSEFQVFNIGTGVEHSVLDIADMVGGMKEYVEARNEPRRAVADITRATAVLGWEPSITLEDGINQLQ